MKQRSVHSRNWRLNKAIRFLPRTWQKPARLFIFLTALIALAYGTLSPRPPQQSIVDYVIDGDTVILNNGKHVRLIGIDTPEIKSKYSAVDEFYGPEAKEYLTKWITGKTVRLENGEELYDRYQRRLAYLILDDGTMINREMVRLGYAEATRKWPHPYREEFLGLEQDAKDKRLGVWSEK